MRKIIFIFAFISANFISYLAVAEVDGASDEALKKVQGVLTNKGAREDAKKTDGNLQKVDNDIDALTSNPQNKEALYQAASKILGEVAKEANGDPQKMQELMIKAQKDPAAFLNSMSESNKKLIRSIAEDIEKTKVDSKKP